MKAIKLLITILSALLLIAIICINVSAALPPMFAGDVDCSGNRTIKDATLIQKYLTKIFELNNIQQALANVDGDNSITVKDATLIQMRCAKIINVFPVSDEIWDTINIQSFNADGNSNVVPVGVPVTFNVSVSATPEPITFDYIINDEIIIKNTSNSSFTYTFDEIGIYSIKTVAYNGFGTTSNITIDYEVINCT